MSNSTVLARTFASVPARTADETWSSIVALLAPDESSDARTELAQVSGVACSCITDETLRDDALVVYGAGPRLRVYCVYGDDAIEGDGVCESALAFVPTDGDWRLSIPCLPEDLEWVSRYLSKVSQRVTTRATGDDVNDLGARAKLDDRGRSALKVTLDSFLRG